MKYTPSCFIIILVLFVSVQANSQTITINWTISDTTNVTEYKMYYSYDSDMAEKYLACSTTDATANSLTCNNIDLINPIVYLAIYASTGSNEYTSNTVSESIITQISKVQDFKIWQESSPPLSEYISEDFSIDLTDNFINISGELSIQNGNAQGKEWTVNDIIHNTSLNSSNQIVTVDLYYPGGSDGGGVIGRYNAENKTGYYAYISGNRVHLVSYQNGVKTWISTSSTYEFEEGVYSLKFEIIGSSIKIYVNDFIKINVNNSEHTTGTQAGFRINRGSENSAVTIDNFTAIVAN